MSEYIERGALLDRLKFPTKEHLAKRFIEIGSDQQPIDVLVDTSFELSRAYLETVTNAPAADVEPVVRCKDCVKWGKRDCKRNPCAIDISSMDEFCSDGERKAHMERSGSGE